MTEKLSNVLIYICYISNNTTALNRVMKGDEQARSQLTLGRQGPFPKVAQERMYRISFETELKGLFSAC